MPVALVSSRELEERLGEPNLRVLDASWHMPQEERDAKAEFARQHIPGARFFDIEAISDHDSPYPHMLPPPEEFAGAVARLGISNENDIVVYDGAGLFSAARAWWMFRAFGHMRVRVLDGGLPKWLAEGRALEHGEAGFPPLGRFLASLRPEMVWSKGQVLENLASQAALVVDARGAPRFSGSAAEPRPGMRSGHIPGSKNIPYATCLTGAYGEMKPAEELQQLFAQAGVDPAQPLVTSCGSGVTACILSLALHEMGYPDTPVYDGSWAEWGSCDDMPVEEGEAA